MSRSLVCTVFARRRSRVMLAGIALAAGAALAMAAAPKAVGDKPWWTIDGGGGRSTGGATVLQGTAGQPDAGAMTGGGYSLVGGFWHGGPTVTGVGPQPGVPGAQAPPLRFQFHPVHPNPFNPATTIAFDLPAPGRVLVRVYNVRGELVATLLDASYPAGRFTLTWRGQDDRGVEVGSGVYVVTLDAGEHHARQKIALVR